MEQSLYIPKIYFKYAFPLDEGRRSLYKEKNIGEYPAKETVFEQSFAWAKVWEEKNQGDQIIKEIIKILGVTLPKDMDFYIFGASLDAMSNPLMMPIIDRETNNTYTDSKFIEVAIHELIHRFIADRRNNPGIQNYWKAIQEKYSAEDPVTKKSYSFIRYIKYCFKKPLPE